MIIDRDPGDEDAPRHLPMRDARVKVAEAMAWGWTRSAERIALEDAMINARIDHITALLGGVGLPSQRILERTLERQKRQQQAQRQHHQGRLAA